MLSRSKQGAFEGFSPENSERMKEQQKQIIKVIMGNPPWSAFNQDLRYPEMDKRIFETYQKYTSTTLKNALYDAYVRSLRWASDRLGEDGVIAFVTNGSFIDSSTGDGIRKCWREEFQTIYCFNLRGDVHQGKKEGGSVFGSGTTRRVAITLLIKNSQYKHKPCQIFYKDIGDYLTRDEKLEKIASLKSIKGIDDWQRIEPDAYNDWINLRDPTFQQYMPLGSDDTKRGKANDAIFYSFCRGVATNRDAWVYNSSKEVLRQNMQHTITFYNQQIDENRQVPIQSLSDITWTRRIKKLFQKRERVIYKDSHIRLAMYRPFFKQWLYLDHAFNEEVYKIPSFFPTAETENQLICITGKGSKKPFSTFIVDTIPDLNLLAAGVQCFPRYTYEELEDRSLFSELREWRRVDNILDETLERFCRHYNDRSITKDDIFYYVYGVLHSYEYREMYGSNLTRELPRIPLARDFRVFVRAGRDLAHLHLRYEELDGYRLREEWSGMGSSLGFIGGEEWGGMGRYVGGEERYYRVEKLRYGKKRGLVRGKERVVKDRSMIVLNEYLTVSGIPEDAYRYEVNGRTPLDWLVERYRVLSDEGSGIVNDVNSWGGLWYILGLIGRLVRVGVESYEIMKSLPSPFE